MEAGMGDNGGRGQEDGIDRRDAILEVVHFSAEQFLRTTPDSEAIQELLARLGAAIGASRAYIFENHVGTNDTRLTSQKFEWIESGVTPEIDNPDLQDFDLEAGGFERWLEVLSRGDIILGPVAEFPTSEREVLEAQSILSIMVVPIFIGSHWWGFIGFDDCVATRKWSRTEIEALETAAAILSAAFERMRVAREVLFDHRELEERVEERTKELAEANEQLRVEISERVKVQEQLRLLAMTDALTGLNNRRGFFTLAEQQLKLAPRLVVGVALMVVDLDELKEINDTLGHNEGDRALIDLAGLLTNCCRGSDVVGRVGGDEFAVFQLVEPGSDAIAQTQRLRDEIDKFGRVEKRAYRLSASIGTAQAAVDEPRTLGDLLAEADRQMYDDKRNRRQPARLTSDGDDGR